MSKIQTKNISTLCSELGFSEDFQGRELKTFTTSITEFRKSFIEKGNQLPYGASDSPEAQHFALAFCQEGNRGETLWPSTPNRSWPSWSSEPSRILESLAHIFALQAFHQYQYNLKKGKKTMPSATPTLSPDRDTRGLSPESMKIVDATPIAPSGTRRRPAKKSGVVVEPVFDKDEQQIYDDCLSEVRSLDPRNDPKPAIKEFNMQWLLKPGARWPVAADTRVKTFMHEYNVYKPDDADIKIIPLITSLRKGTEIEKCETRHWILLKQRTLERISSLVKEMSDKGLLKVEDGTPQKIPLFKDIWVNRHGQWGPKERASKPAATTKRSDVFSTDNLPPDHGPSFRIPTAKMISKEKPPSYTPLFTGTRRKLDDTAEGAAPNEQRIKKRKTTGMATGFQAIIAPPLDQPTTLPSVNSVEDDLQEDSVTAENIEFARECLSFDNELEAQQPAQPSPRMHSTPKDTRPMTPTSPAATSSSFQRASRAPSTPGRAALIQGIDTSNTATIPPEQRTLQASPPPRAEIRQAVPANLPPALILEKADGSFDDENPLPSAHFRNSNVEEFFDFVSEETTKPRESFDRLTFTLTFAAGNDRTWLIHEGDQASWNKLKNKARFLCNLYGTRVDETELQLVVEFGDKKNMVAGMNAIW